MDHRRLLRRQAAEAAAGDLGQQRAFHFIGNRVYNCSGVKLLGGKHAIIVGNSFRVPINYAVFIGADGYGEGPRVSEDVLVSGNNITDLVTADQAGAGDRLQRRHPHQPVQLPAAQRHHPRQQPGAAHRRRPTA